MYDRPELIGNSPDMTVDPLSEIVTLLQPSASYSKLVDMPGAGASALSSQASPSILPFWKANAAW